MKCTAALFCKPRVVLLLVPAVLLVSLAGCAIIGVIAGKVLPLPTIEPKYLGLAGKTTAIMIWADTGIQIDYPSVQLDIGASVQKKLLDAAIVDKKQKQIQGITFPYSAASVVRFQQ